MTPRDRDHEKALATCEHLCLWFSPRSDLVVKKAIHAVTHQTDFIKLTDGTLYHAKYAYMVSWVVQVIIKKMGRDGTVIIDCTTGEVSYEGVDAMTLVDPTALQEEVFRVSDVFDSIEALRDLESV